MAEGKSKSGRVARDLARRSLTASLATMLPARLATGRPGGRSGRPEPGDAETGSAEPGDAETGSAEPGDGSRDWPYASLVTVACTQEGAPLLLLSDLAAHSRNIARDSRVALLFTGGPGAPTGAEAGAGAGGDGAAADPLAVPRVTVLGRAERTEDAGHPARFLARHPEAAAYAGFGDFHVYRVAVERAHLVAGFGRAYWMAVDDFLFTGATDDLAAGEAKILTHMNARHGAALARWAGRLAKIVPTADGNGPWRLIGVDPEGVDLRYGTVVTRLDFGTPVGDGAAARAELTRLAE